MMQLNTAFAFAHKGWQHLRMCGVAPSGHKVIVDCKVKGQQVQQLRMHRQVSLDGASMSKAPVPADWVGHLTSLAIKHQFD